MDMETNSCLSFSGPSGQHKKQCFAFWEALDECNSSRKMLFCLCYSHVLGWSAWKNDSDHPSSQIFTLLLVLRFITLRGLQFGCVLVNWCGLGWVTWVQLFVIVANGKERHIQSSSFWSCHSWCSLQAVHSLETNNEKKLPMPFFYAYGSSCSLQASCSVLIWQQPARHYIKSNTAALHSGSLWLLFQDMWRTFFTASFTSPDLWGQSLYSLIKPPGYSSSYCIPPWSAAFNVCLYGELYRQRLAVWDGSL